MSTKNYDCACMTDIAYDGEGVVVDMCKLHEAAPRLRDMLEELQWNIKQGECPECGSEVKLKHERTCRLDALLREVR